MSRVLVIGASGFVGRRLVPALLKENHTVVAASRRSAVSIPGEVQQVPLDITDPESFKGLPEGIDTIVHAAADRPGSASATAVRTAFLVNTLGTINVLAYAEALNIKRVVYCSTLSVYALPQAIPIAEEGRTYPVQAPDSYYGISKLAGESICERFRQERRLTCLSLRLGRIYGPGEYAGSLVSNWVQTARNREDIVVYGDGMRSLDFIYIDDAVRGIVNAVQARSEGGVINMGSGVETSWGTLAEAIVEVFSPPQGASKVVYIPEGNRERCYLDISLARTVLGFAPQFTLREGLLAWRNERMAA